MIRGLVATPLLLIALVLGGFYEAYGEVDPCRALAVEEARMGEKSLGGVPVEDALESWKRVGTSQMSEGHCARELVHSWWERVVHAFD